MYDKDLYEEGIYSVEALSWGYLETSNGHDQFEMTFGVRGKVDRNNPEGPAQPCEEGHRSWSITLTSESNAAWLTDVVLGLGYDGEDLLGLDPDLEGAPRFHGRRVLRRVQAQRLPGPVPRAVVRVPAAAEVASEGACGRPQRATGSRRSRGEGPQDGEGDAET